MADPSVQTSDLETLLAVQEELEQLNDRAAAAILELESKFAADRVAILRRRAELTSRLPRFWLAIFSLDPVVGPMLTKLDREVLSHVTDFQLHVYDDVRKGFRFTITLDESNPHFPERSLAKAFNVDEQGVIDSAAVVPSFKPDTSGGGAAAAMDVLTPTPVIRPAARAMERGSFLSWFTSSETIASGERDELAEYIKRTVFANPLLVLLKANQG